MKKLFTTLFALGLLIPIGLEAGVSPEGRSRPRKPKCKESRGVVVCRMPKPRKPKKCGIMPCIPRGYFRPNPPKRIPV